MNEITYEGALRLDDPIFIDVRAPCEFILDHIPGSINMPIFDDKERSEIGKVYRFKGKEDAIIKGSEIAGLKIGNFISNIYKYWERDIVIGCFRGGMRSTTMVSLFMALGLNVYKLTDGYKGYRKYVNLKLPNIEIKPQVFVLHGLTGTGKTEIIRRIENSVDLEGLAGHRSSVFGGIGLNQRTQKMFESLLFNKINEHQDREYIVMEGESRKIGNLHIPKKIHNIIQDSHPILINASIQRRVEILLKEYTGNIDAQEIIIIVESLESRIGKKNVKILIELFQKGELFDFTRMLLEKYYDPLYKYSIGKIKYIDEIENNDNDLASEVVKKVISEFLKG